MAIGLARLRRLRTAGEPSADTADQDELQRILGTRADVRYVADLRHPVTFGVLRPVVLLPSALLGRPDEIKRAVLAHELLHVQRRDWAWLLVEESVRAIFWFHPAMWWLISRVQLAREVVVDETAVAITGRRRIYVEALLAFADRVPLTPAPAFAERRHLFRRIVLVSREVSMSSKRIVASCALMALAVVAGSWYAIGAFPLRTLPAAPTPQAQAGPGPLESRANPITPENPIPRRISHVEAEFPPEAAAADARGRVVLRVTLDESGRVGEVRPTDLSARMTNPLMTASFNNVSGWDSKRVSAESITVPSGDSTRAVTILDAMARAATDAVRQWQYDPPFKAPISFNVTVHFGDIPPPPPPPPPPAAVIARKVQAAPPPPPPPPPEPARRGGRGGVTGGVPGGVPGGVSGGVVGGVAGATTTRSVQGTADEYDKALRVGSKIAAPTKLVHVDPVYPEVARAAKVQGVVIVEARIEADGTVSDVKILRSIPLLNQAALDAVRQWVFRPVLLNGAPVPVIMTVTVPFRLD
jgi:protein TonB